MEFGSVLRAGIGGDSLGIGLERGVSFQGMIEREETIRIKARDELCVNIQKANLTNHDQIHQIHWH